MKKAFKALMIDVDGTLVDYGEHALPSEKVTQAVNKASSKLHVGLATSRGLAETKNIAKHLNLTGPSILNGGALVMDIQKQEIYYENPIPGSIALEIIKIFDKHKVRIYVNHFNGDIPATLDNISSKFYNMFSAAQEEKKAKEIVKELEPVAEVQAVYVPSWTHGKFDILVYQANATKQHGILEVAKILNIDTHDIIGIGDGYNDFPLLLACGLKVAMGNANEGLKEIADYIAPSVYDDGVADVIERYVL